MTKFDSLSPELKALWTAVYAAVVQGHEVGCGKEDSNAEKQGCYAEKRAWEAVRRATAAESVPPTDDMIDALAPIVAAALYADYADSSEATRARLVAYAAREMREPHACLDLAQHATVTIAIAAWKAAKWTA